MVLVILREDSIFGLEYVGLSNAAYWRSIIWYTPSTSRPERVTMLNAPKATIVDVE